jgi:hypothetical protein
MKQIALAEYMVGDSEMNHNESGNQALPSSTSLSLSHTTNPGG